VKQKVFQLTANLGRRKGMHRVRSSQSLDDFMDEKIGKERKNMKTIFKLSFVAAILIFCNLAYAAPMTALGGLL
jgi:hypothetical protein